MVKSYTIGGFQTNTYVVYNDRNECIIIDPSLDFKSIYNEIVDRYEVKAILLTHGHLDHIDGCRYFKDLPIYIYKDEERMLYDSHLSLYDMIGSKTPFSKGDLKIVPLNDNQTFNLIGFDIKIIHTPGHTAGSSCYWIDGDLFTGDTLFYFTCGRTDFPTGSMDDIVNSVRLLVKAFPEDTIVFPGHDRTTTIGNEKKHNYCLRG